MPRGIPVDAETRTRIAELIQAGDLGRNAIARETGVAAPVVSGIAQELGIAFDRSKSALMIEVSKIDRAKMRADLADAMLIEAWRATEDMHAPTLRVEFESGKQVQEYDSEGKLSRTSYKPGKFRTIVLPEPTASDRRNLMTVAGIAISKAAELTKEAANAGSADALSFIDGMDATLAKVREFIEGSSGADTDPEADPTLVDREAMIADLEAQESTPDDDPSV